jgi:hypothetical protein
VNVALEFSLNEPVSSSIKDLDGSFLLTNRGPSTVWMNTSVQYAGGPASVDHQLWLEVRGPAPSLNVVEDECSRRRPVTNATDYALVRPGESLDNKSDFGRCVPDDEDKPGVYTVVAHWKDGVPQLAGSAPHGSVFFGDEIVSKPMTFEVRP